MEGDRFNLKRAFHHEDHEVKSAILPETPVLAIRSNRLIPAYGLTHYKNVVALKISKKASPRRHEDHEVLFLRDLRVFVVN